jgi:hypothetical protein
MRMTPRRMACEKRPTTRQYRLNRAQDAASVAPTRSSIVSHEPPLASRGSTRMHQASFPKPGRAKAVNSSGVTSANSIAIRQNA